MRAGNEVAESTVLGADAFSCRAASAALVNGTAGHALDFDDTQLSSSPDRIFGLLTHPTIPPLAASLALGERLGVSGRQLLEAYLIGFEVECKMAEAIDPSHYRNGFHSSGTFGIFGAMVSAAKLLGLDAGAIANALAIASSMSSGIRLNFGTMTKPLHVGRAAQNGVMAAELAARGHTGGGDALESPWGFFRVFTMGAGFDPSRLVGALGNPPSIVSPGVSLKPYPCGSLGHPSMDAMLKLVETHDVKPEQVRGIRLRTGSNILNWCVSTWRSDIRRTTPSPRTTRVGRRSGCLPIADGSRPVRTSWSPATATASRWSSYPVSNDRAHGHPD